MERDFASFRLVQELLKERMSRWWAGWPWCTSWHFVVWCVSRLRQIGTGFAYGTLPGHPEVGEESFVFSRGLDGRTVFEITAFSRPAGLVARVGAPIARAVQNAVTDEYVEAVRATSTR